MMCMECKSDYVSTARDTLNFCSAQCELKNKSRVEAVGSRTAYSAEALIQSSRDLAESHICGLAVHPDSTAIPELVVGRADVDQ
jgi:hypothetical protein